MRMAVIWMFYVPTLLSSVQQSHNHRIVAQWYNKCHTTMWQSHTTKQRFDSHVKLILITYYSRLSFYIINVMVKKKKIWFLLLLNFKFIFVFITVENTLILYGLKNFYEKFGSYLSSLIFKFCLLTKYF